MFCCVTKLRITHVMWHVIVHNYSFFPWAKYSVFTIGFTQIIKPTFRGESIPKIEVVLNSCLMQPLFRYGLHRLHSYLGPLYTRSQGWNNLGPTLSIFGLLFGPELLIDAGTLAPRVANWLPKFYSILFFCLEANTRP